MNLYNKMKYYKDVELDNRVLENWIGDVKEFIKEFMDDFEYWDSQPSSEKNEFAKGFNHAVKIIKERMIERAGNGLVEWEAKKTK